MTEPNDTPETEEPDAPDVQEPDAFESDPLLLLEKRVKRLEDLEDLLIHSGLDFGHLREVWNARNG